MSLRSVPLLAALAWLACWPACATMGVVEGAPEGFEQLDVPRPSVIALYYGGDYIGAFPVQITPNLLTFDDPVAVITAIPTIQDKDAILQEMKKPMPVHASEICRARQTENCGVLDPEIVGIIFNEANLDGELFLNKKYLSVVNDNRRYLPLPPKHFSSVYGFNGAVSGATDEDMNYTVANNSIFSLGEKKLVTQSSVSDNGLRFDTAALSVERNGWNKSAGLLRSTSTQLIGDLDMAGVSLATSSNTVLDAQKTQGNDLLVYLPRRSFVSIYREGRLYSSRTYEAGNQIIDTSELPDGAYNVTLRIQETNGTTRDETRFFVKNEDIPPVGHPVYYSQFGVVRQSNATEKNIPELTSKPLLRMGTRRRISDSIGLGIGATGINDRAATEASIYWITPHTKLQSTLMGSTRGDAGYNVNYLYTAERFNASFDVRQLSSSKAPDLVYQNLFSDYRQLTGTLAYAATPTLTLGLRGSYAEQNNAPTSSSVGPYAQWRIWQRGESLLELGADMARTENETKGDVLLRLTHRFGDYGVTATGGRNFGKNGGTTAGTRAWYQKNEDGTMLLVGGGANSDQYSRTINADADWRNHFGQVRGSVQRSIGDTGSSTGYGGNFSFNAAQLDHKVHIGGSQSDNSAVIVRTSGNARTAMKIFVNGSERGLVKVGEEQVIYLSPFHTYRVTLSPAEPGLFDYDSNNHSVTLYPGNVAALEWKITNFYVVVGNIIHPDGTPVADALLQKTRAQITTGANGQLQAEIADPHILSFSENNTQSCDVTLPENIQPVNGILLYPTALICVPPSQNSFSTASIPSQIE